MKLQSQFLMHGIFVFTYVVSTIFLKPSSEISSCLKHVIFAENQFENKTAPIYKQILESLPFIWPRMVFSCKITEKTTNF